MNTFQIFFIGILTALGALVLESVVFIVAPEISNFRAIFSLDFYLLITIFIEEILKIILFWKVINYPKNQKNIYLSAVFLGSGFATVEILFNILSNNFFNLDVLFSYFGLILIHIFTLLIYASYFRREKKFSASKIILAFTLGYLIHSVFNFLVFYAINPFLIDASLLILTIISITFGFLAKKTKLN